MVMYASPLCVLIIGFVVVFRRFKRLKADYDFAVEFFDQFQLLDRSYINNHNNHQIDQQAYVWLTRNANQMQIIMGHSGVMAVRQPFENAYISNYPLILNTLPKYREGSVSNQERGWVFDSLLRYEGISQQDLKRKRQELYNPIIWFANGLRFIIGLPIYILNWLDLIPDSTLVKIVGNGIYKAIVLLTGLLGVMANIAAVRADTTMYNIISQWYTELASMF